jgi:hypothetical protein
MFGEGMMINVDIEYMADLEEQLEHEIRCSGMATDPFRPIIPCDNPAVLISYGHGCPSLYPLVKCMSCWQAWYAYMVEKAHRHGGFNICVQCRQRFYRISDLSDYRPL